VLLEKAKQRKQNKKKIKNALWQGRDKEAKQEKV